jgi:hypothetical protein
VIYLYPGCLFVAPAASSIPGSYIKAFIETTFAYLKPAIQFPVHTLVSPQVVLDRTSLVTNIMLGPHFFQPPKRSTIVYTFPPDPSDYLPLLSLTSLNPTKPPSPSSIHSTLPKTPLIQPYYYLNPHQTSLVMFPFILHCSIHKTPYVSTCSSLIPPIASHYFPRACYVNADISAPPFKHIYSA